MKKLLILLLILLLPTISKAEIMADKYKTAIFAGGCFWCMEKPFDETQGVIKTTSGYSGGTAETATYPQVSSGKTAHLESIEVTYDPQKVDYATLLNVFWANIDPLDDKGQFCDKGEQYLSAIFYQNEDERKTAEKSKLFSEKLLGEKIATKIVQFKSFYPAEDYHQDYYKKNPIRYKYYRYSCGRDKRLEELKAK